MGADFLKEKTEHVAGVHHDPMLRATCLITSPAYIRPVASPEKDRPTLARRTAPLGVPAPEARAGITRGVPRAQEPRLRTPHITTAPGATVISQVALTNTTHTRCGSEQDMTLAMAQRGLVDPPNGFFAGADTDTLGPSVRFDGCHLATSGQMMAADLWRQRIESAAAYPSPR